MFALDTLILAATMVVVGSVTGAGSMEGACAVVEVHPEPIDGPRIEGFVLDRHVISSRPIGYLGELCSSRPRSALGELV